MGGVSEPLIRWFEQHRRLLPFRQEPSAYHIWISEIMLQQTRVSAALPYYERFVVELPDPAALAACEPDRLRKLWQGLGYYSRAANLQKAAGILCDRYGGELPADYDALRALPGIGDYTAGAIASIAFGIPVPAVDGNVLRVFARLTNDDSDITRPETKRSITRLVMEEMPRDRPGAYNEALMELGALVCLPNGAPRFIVSLSARYVSSSRRSLITASLKTIDAKSKSLGIRLPLFRHINAVKIILHYNITSARLQHIYSL